jgi:hypothetical protein
VGPRAWPGGRMTGPCRSQGPVTFGVVHQCSTGSTGIPIKRVLVCLYKARKMW